MRFTLTKLLLALLSARSWLPHPAHAHRTIPSGATCGTQFSTPETALTIPNTEISWATYRYFTCDEPVMWLEAAAEKNQKLKFTLTVPVLERFEDVRMSVVFVGPSLPSLPSDTDVPDDITASIQNGEGAVLFKSPQDQSTCDHLQAVMKSSSSVVNNRCHFYEPFGGSNSWVVLDEELEAVEAGVHKIAVFAEGGTAAKASFACCDWPEDFITNYAMPEADCPYCGTSEVKNPAWSSLFYEQKTMEQYGGFPAAGSCDNPSTLGVQPTEAQCPPVSEASTESQQPASCALGCNNEGQCHSHNIFGECTHDLDWSLQPKFGDAKVSELVIFKGDKVNFKYTGDTGLAHNLFEMVDDESLQICDFTDATPLADTEQVLIGHTVTFNEPGTFRFACGISCTEFPNPGGETAENRVNDENVGPGMDLSFCHCTIGQKLTVEVKDSTEGMRCHDHKQTATSNLEPLTCPFGLVNARTIGNLEYGTKDDTECAELCTPANALPFMAAAGIKEGRCKDEGFTYAPAKKEVEPSGSQNPVEVLVTSNVEPSTCHCHSYEQISCPEAGDDALYDEHIEEIEKYCSGIVSGTEDSCPYKCFQPMEVLHLHYLECKTRTVDPTYIAVNATEKCHIAAIAPEDTNCPKVSLAGLENNGKIGPRKQDVKDGNGTSGGSAKSWLSNIGLILGAAIFLPYIL